MHQSQPSCQSTFYKLDATCHTVNKEIKSRLHWMPKNYFKYSLTQCVQEVCKEAPVFQQGKCIHTLCVYFRGINQHHHLSHHDPMPNKKDCEATVNIVYFSHIPSKSICCITSTTQQLHLHFPPNFIITKVLSAVANQVIWPKQSIHLTIFTATQQKILPFLLL